MGTLLLRLAAPIQSWGGETKFERRGTEAFPTKSGIIGLVAAALGRRRNESLEDLTCLKFGVRIDREGVLLRDYHTVKASKSYVTQRYYLSDAVFLAALEGDDSKLEEIERAIRRPAFPLFLGRRSCPPEGKICLGVKYGLNLLDALREEPSLVSPRTLLESRTLQKVRIIAENFNEVSNSFTRDLPISYNQSHRQYTFRKSPDPILYELKGDCYSNETEHDPFTVYNEE